MGGKGGGGLDDCAGRGEFHRRSPGPQGQCNRAGGAHEQAGAKQLLELADLRGHGGLGAVDPDSSAGEAAGFGEVQERVQQGNVERQHGCAIGVGAFASRPIQ